ncbi:MAG TPA: DUF2993 domain-containing protein [Mycobacteriales bacterium]|jgi:hypothetical protein|nr:DUF2993 domain-containing protein [Mycobacteriales bacterium]
MRRLVVTVLVLVALLAALDRVALWGAQHDVAERLQADAHLRTAPSVTIHGYPFLTQLIGGNYDDVDVVMRGLDSGGLRIDKLSVHVHGAHVSLSDVVSQNRSRIHVDRASAQMLLTYADLEGYVRNRLGAAAPAHVDHSVVTSASVRGSTTVVLHTSAGDLPITLTGLPFGIHLTSAKATQVGVEVSGSATGLVLRT